MKPTEAIQELRKSEKKKFVQTVDLIVNLQKFDVRKEALNTFIQLPFAGGKRICAFLTRKTPLADTIIKSEFEKYKNEADIKRLAKSYDSFIAVASLMPSVATTFGRVLGPAGKMPSPQAGIVPLDDDNSVKAMIEKMNKSVRIRTKEKSIKIPIGKESMSDKELAENLVSAVSSIENLLPRRNDNIKNIMIKLTMSKSIKVEVK
jgi:large subunit ribosomal protein L1